MPVAFVTALGAVRSQHVTASLSPHVCRPVWLPRRPPSCCAPPPGPQFLEPYDPPASLSGPYPPTSAVPPPLSECAPDSASISYDGGDGASDGGRGSSGSGSGDSSSGDSGEDDSSLPDDMRAALAYGSLTRDAVARFRTARLNPMLAFLLSIRVFRSRFLMDPSFLFKLAVQELVGNGTSLAGEIVVRGKDIVHELEYVASDLIIGTVIEAAFVWLLAPTLPLPAAPGASALSKLFNSLPAHIFQPSTALQTFSLSQRIACFFVTAAQYAGIGFAGGLVGTAITYGLLEARKAIDKDYKPFRPLPAVLPNSLGWAAFMAASCNTRFQFVEGLEMGVAKLLAARSEKAVNAAIVTLRFINNYYGGVQFVQFFRAIGLHATGESEHETVDGDVGASNGHQ